MPLFYLLFCAHTSTSSLHNSVVVMKVVDLEHAGYYARDKHNQSLLNDHFFYHLI